MNPIRILLIFGAIMSFFVALLPNVLWVLGSLVSLLMGRHLRYAPFGYVSLALVIAVIMALAYGFWAGRWNLRIKNVEYHNDSLPVAFRDFKIVHISDLHLNTFDDAPQKLQGFVDAINSQHPDLVCFTGDLVTTGKSEAEPYAKTLKGIEAKHGVVSVLGNHDFLIYNRSLESEEERLKAVEELTRYEREELGC